MYVLPYIVIIIIIITCIIYTYTHVLFSEYNNDARFTEKPDVKFILFARFLERSIY